jgi:hypothetical protein
LRFPAASDRRSQTHADQVFSPGKSILSRIPMSAIARVPLQAYTACAFASIAFEDIDLAADHPDNPVPLRMHAIAQDAIPKGRSGKHKQIVTLLLKRLNQLTPGKALKISLAELPDTKANIRSALHRATRLPGPTVATSSDEGHLYIWKVAGR